MNDAAELERLAEADGAQLIRTATGAWYAKDRDGITVVRGALSRAEAALHYVEDKGLVDSTPEALLAYLKAQYRPYDRLPAFEEGYAAHAKRQHHNPYPSSVEAQA